MVVALGLTTTAFGTLLPILRDNDLLGGRFGRYLLAAGAVGELAVVLTFAPRLVRGNRLERVLHEGEGSTPSNAISTPSATASSSCCSSWPRA